MHSKARMCSKLALRALAVIIVAAAALSWHAPTALGQANVQGTWQTLPTLMPINPVHTALMPNGKILIVSGSGNYPVQTTYMVGLWDPSNNTVTTSTQPWDMFCNGMVNLPDGRPFVMGGNLQYDPFFGWQRTSVYDPATAKYTDMEDMAHGRWYPTATVLGDGRVMVFSGLTETGGTNSQVEIYKVGVGWGTAVTASWTPPLYPRMHLLPSGKVFYSGASTQSRTFDPTTNTWSGVIATTKYGGTRTYGTSILLPLTPANSYKPKIMIFGGGNPSTATTEIIDMSAATPAWVSGPPMSQPRIEMNGTLLPNGKILTVGGSLNDEDTSTASLQADLYDSTTNTMGSAGSNAFARLYHSVSLLLPDGTVWVAGGNPVRGTYEQHVEIYTPPYLYKSDGTFATRPTITSVSTGVIGYGTSFSVQTPDAANISSVVLMKDGAVTHAFDMDQRMVGLSFTKGSGVLNLTGPPNGNTAPPGYYMLFLLNSSGVPSVAKIIQVSKTPTDVPPTGTITSPATDVLIAPGQTVTFAGTGTATTGSITGYSWVFRGGSPGKSSLANPGAVTFSTAGTYTAIFTVTDTAGNTDPSPKTRTITVATAPAPSLTSITPNTGKQGTTSLSVVLGGTNFLTGATCSFGAGITINSCTYNSSTKITANINVLASATVGTRNVTVTNTDGQNSTVTNGFTVQAGAGNPAPTITSVVPNNGTQGQSNVSVVITGTNFLTGPSCDFDSDEGLTVTACTYNSATKITATLNIAANAVLGGHNIVVTDTDGQSATLVNGFTVNASGGGGSIGFGSGFTAGSMVVNGNTTISGTALALTTTVGTFQAGSAWFPTPVNIQNFTTDFTFQTTAGASTADGFTFALQGNSTTALGSSGGSLGWFGIGNSVGVKFDLYSNNGEGPDSTGIYLNGAAPQVPAVDMTSSGVDLHSGHVFRVHMTYDGTNLVMTITDNTTAATFTQSWAVNIPGAVGGATAFAGFTAATGGYTSNQNILTWTLSSSIGGGGTVATPTFSLPGGVYLGTQTLSLSDSTAGATIFYTTDGTQPGTVAGGSTVQYSTPLTVTSTKTIKALATASGKTTSATASATYTIESQVATPTFSPLGATYTSAQNVTISSTTSGASIYYTTNGATPTSSSTLYSGPVSVGVSETLKAIATKSGFFDSNVGSAVYTINTGGGGGGISFGSGFTAGSMVLNGNSTISGTSLSITPNTTNQIGSAWFPTAVNVQNFTTDFTFQTTTGASTADGFTFALQGNSTSAIGGGGGSLGWFGIAKSVGVKFDLYSNAGEGVNSTGLYLNGAAPSTPFVDLTGSGIDLHSGHVFQVHMSYDGTNLAMTITDATTAASFTQSWAVDIPGTVGGATAFAGFTGATGGLTSLQKILTWTMSSSGGASTVATPTFSPGGGSYGSAQSVTISTTTSGANIYYTTNGTTPTTSSTLYGGPVAVATTETLKALAAKSGSNNSAVATASYTIGAVSQINYSAGFTAGNLTFNGNAALNGSRLQVTDINQNNEVSSAWFNTRVNVQKFTTDFNLQLTAADADGMTFAIQSNNTAALGFFGGGLGYGSDTIGGPGIANSVAIKFDLYDNGGEGGNSIGLYTGGASPTTPAITLGGGVDLHSGHILSVHIVYDGTTLTMTITDTTNTSLTFTKSWTVNIPTAVNATTAYVGFTGGTGGLTAQQQVVSWTYTVN